MSQRDTRSAQRPAPDQVLQDIADYAIRLDVGSELALDTARHCLMDALACGFQALGHPACARRMGPGPPAWVRVT